MKKETAHKIEESLNKILDDYSDKLDKSQEALEYVKTSLSALCKLKTLEKMETGHDDDEPMTLSKQERAILSKLLTRA